MSRPTVDVVVPFTGAQHELEALLQRLELLELAPGDSITVVDNRPGGASATQTTTASRVVRAAELRSSYYARNRGAALANAEWILFMDADVVPRRDLLARYFDPTPADRSAILVGGIEDESDTDAPVSRFVGSRRDMSQENTLGHGRWAYAQTANCAVRRRAFEKVGGFESSVRSGGDADICFRLGDAGWEMERRDRASVVHRNRRTLRSLVRQRARHGAGAEWLNRRYPGSFPRGSWLGLGWWSLRSMLGGATSWVSGDRDGAVDRLIEPVAGWAFAIGRLLPNTASRNPGPQPS